MAKGENEFLTILMAFYVLVPEVLSRVNVRPDTHIFSHLSALENYKLKNKIKKRRPQKTKL